MKKQQKYEYMLPRDEKRLMVDAITYGMLDAIKDGMNMADNIEEKAKSIDLCKSTTNDFEVFQKIIVESYVAGYIEKQKRFRKDITLHDKEVKGIASWGDNAFSILRENVDFVTQSLTGEDNEYYSKNNRS